MDCMKKKQEGAVMSLVGDARVAEEALGHCCSAGSLTINGVSNSADEGAYRDVDQHYLELLSTQYTNRVAVFSEIINLQAILNLPKSTEHFVSDLHGEYEAFCHIINSCSGVIRSKVDEILTTLSEEERAELCTLIYYPHDVMKKLKDEGKLTDDWFRSVLYRLIAICKYLSAKYTRSKVRKAINKNYAYIIDELLHAQSGETDSRKIYHAEIIDTILRTDAAHHFVSSLCALCKRLAVDHLHIVGDIYDRGPAPDKIMAILMDHHSIDIEWGNHDILWMGAALGSEVCIATVLRNNINYHNCSLLESSYGISLRRLDDFARKTYKYPTRERSSANHQSIVEVGDAATAALASEAANRAGSGSLNIISGDGLSNAVQEHEDKNSDIADKAYADEKRCKMVKALTVIALKLQGQLIKRNPEFGMDNRLLLDKMDLEKGTVTIENVTWELNTVDLPTVDFKDPFALSKEEQSIMNDLKRSFLQSRLLQQEVAFLFSHGSIYKRFNGNLLYHGCVPFTPEGEFREINCHGTMLKGKDFLDYCEKMARMAYAEHSQQGLDFMYFLWCGVNSPLSGRVMKPFERYFIDDKTSHKEPRDPYYSLYFREDICRKILSEFGLDPDKGHIINGHTPIRVKEGESPVRGNGKLFVIDGGLCQAYHKTTGIAGYTLIFSSRGLILKAHRPFESKARAVEDKIDIVSEATEVEHYDVRLKVSQSDNGKKIERTIHELEALLYAYRAGIIPERESKR